MKQKLKLNANELQKRKLRKKDSDWKLKPKLSDNARKKKNVADKKKRLKRKESASKPKQKLKDFESKKKRDA